MCTAELAGGKNENKKLFTGTSSQYVVWFFLKIVNESR
jgi:hypothetical protein